MRYHRTQFNQQYYQLWQMGLLLPNPLNGSVYSVKYRKDDFDVYSRVTLTATSVSDALERACYAITYSSLWRPEDIDLQAVYDEDDNILWLDEYFYNIVQKKNEFQGMERREFLAKFGMTSAVLLFGLQPSQSFASNSSVNLSGTAAGFSGEQIYNAAGSYTWVVPASVTSVSVVCIGGGGGAGYGPAGANGGNSSFMGCIGNGGVGTSGGAASGGSYTGDGGGTGGSNAASTPVSGGGAGGYSGNGARGTTYGESGIAGTGGGGGVGLFGLGANGAAGSNGAGGGGGSGGSAGGNSTGSSGGSGGAYGGGGGGGYAVGYGASGGGLGYKNAIAVTPGQSLAVEVGAGGAKGVESSCGNGGGGAVRIMWGAGRSFPNNA